ncbi:hypothetical protein RB595_010500 [Gaeumannomyces hyphopodioides]
MKQEVFQKQFPAIKRQISNLRAAFDTAQTEFAKNARSLLVELRDGETDENAKSTELLAAVALSEQHTALAEDFIIRKHTEASVLRASVTKLLECDFENYLGRPAPQPMVGGAPRLLLSFGGPSIGRDKHPLQASIESWSSKTDAGAVESEEDDAEDGDPGDEEEEWFEDQQTVTTVQQSCAALRQQRLLIAPGATVDFGVASIDKAFRPGKKTKTKTRIGDIVLDNGGKFLIVTGLLPKAPTAPTLTVDNQTITVTWLQERERLEELAVPTTGFTIKYRRRLNPQKDGAFPRANENDDTTEVNCDASKTKAVLSSLSDDCDYEVALSVQTIVGMSAWSTLVVGRTAKLPSVASEMIDFFSKNRGTLSNVPTERVLGPGDMPRSKPWDLDALGAGKKTLFLGLTEVARRYTTDERFRNEIAVRIVDVAADFKPEVKAAPVEDPDKTVVVVFAGTSGHGKSTEINAFISYLLGGEVDDPARILAIDDRGIQQSGSVTQMVTCFRIRPLSSHFQHCRSKGSGPENSPGRPGRMV